MTSEAAYYFTQMVRCTRLGHCFPLILLSYTFALELARAGDSYISLKNYQTWLDYHLEKSHYHHEPHNISHLSIIIVHRLVM